MALDPSTIVIPADLKPADRRVAPTGYVHTEEK